MTPWHWRDVVDLWWVVRDWFRRNGDRVITVGFISFLVIATLDMVAAVYLLARMP